MFTALQRANALVDTLLPR